MRIATEMQGSLYKIARDQRTMAHVQQCRGHAGPVRQGQRPKPTAVLGKMDALIAQAENVPQRLPSSTTSRRLFTTFFGFNRQITEWR